MFLLDLLFDNSEYRNLYVLHKSYSLLKRQRTQNFLPPLWHWTPVSIMFTPACFKYIKILQNQQVHFKTSGTCTALHSLLSPLICLTNFHLFDVLYTWRSNNQLFFRGRWGRCFYHKRTQTHTSFGMLHRKSSFLDYFHFCSIPKAWRINLFS